MNQLQQFKANLEKLRRDEWDKMQHANSWCRLLLTNIINAIPTTDEKRWTRCTSCDKEESELLANYSHDNKPYCGDCFRKVKPQPDTEEPVTSSLSIAGSTVKVWHKDGEGGDAKVYRDGVLANTNGKWELVQVVIEPQPDTEEPDRLAEIREKVAKEIELLEVEPDETKNVYGSMRFLLRLIDEKDKKLERFERALRTYLDAGSKEQRHEASIIAKEALNPHDH